MKIDFLSYMNIGKVNKNKSTRCWASVTKYWEVKH